MRAYRLIFDLLIVVSTTLLLGTIAFDKLSNTDHQLLTNIFLQAMHLSFLLGAVLNLFHQYKSKQYFCTLFTVTPLFFFLVALGGLFVDVRFPVVLLLLFDFYLIYWFFYLFLHDLNP